MKKSFLKIALLFCGILLFGQQVISQNIKQLKTIQPSEAFENIHVKPIYSDERSSTFLIWVKKEVGLHYHAEHTEQLYVIGGKGQLQLGDKSQTIKKGDWIIIPAGLKHSVKVLSKKPLKVVSVQAPEFFNKDRIFVETK